ncbi:hypothetical protein HK096_010006, partial [Nowakowskiella sp. JEL0078]
MTDSIQQHLHEPSDKNHAIAAIVYSLLNSDIKNLTYENRYQQAWSLLKNQNPEKISCRADDQSTVVTYDWGNDHEIFTINEKRQ